MNRINTESQQYYSDFGMDCSYIPEAVPSCSRLRKNLDSLLLRLFALWQILTGATAKRLAKAGGVALALVGMIGVAGAMERGTVSLFAGLAICSVLLTVEFLCLRTGKGKKA